MNKVKANEFKMSSIDEEFMKEGKFDYVRKNNYEGYNETFETIPDNADGLDQILVDLRAGFKTQKTRDVEFRISQLKNLQQGLTDMKDELCASLEKDLGRGPFYAYISEIHLVKVEIQHSIDHLKQWTKDISVNTPITIAPGKSYIRPEPLGVVCVMAAWNYPYYTLLGPVAQVISAGNCCLIKPSELSPNCSIAMAKLCEKYLDKSFYKVIQGQAKVAIKLTSMRFDMVVFTGSTQKGKLVA